MGTVLRILVRKSLLRRHHPRRHPHGIGHIRYKPPFYLHQIIVIHNNTSGSFKYAKAFGVRSLKTQEPLEMDTQLSTASCTKLMTSNAAMQCVERGQASLDMDVGENLPELSKAAILIEFKDAREPVMKKRQKPSRYGISPLSLPFE